MNRTVVYSAAFFLLLALPLGQASADSITLYDQPSNFPNDGVFPSQNDTTPGGFGNFATVYDNFTLTNTSAIADVHWQGGYFNPGEQGNITAFTISFWPDVAGEPGPDPLFTAVIPGNANETFVGDEWFGPIFDYGVDLTTPFVALADTTYWLSIVPDLAFPPQWGWYTGVGGDGKGVIDFFSLGRIELQTDFAFSLTGSVIPEPASLTLFSLGLIGLFGYSRRKQRVLSLES